jgi:hypothetical protein
MGIIVLISKLAGGKGNDMNSYVAMGIRETKAVKSFASPGLQMPKINNKKENIKLIVT